MSHRDAPFRARLLGPNLIEASFDHEIEVEESDVKALHAAYRALVGDQPYAVLVDRSNFYSYSFYALRHIFDPPQIFAVAFLMPGRLDGSALKTLLDFNRDREGLAIALFRERAEALAWLAEQGAVLASA